MKLLDRKGEFISASAGKEVIELAESNEMEFAEVDDLGRKEKDDSFLQKHIDAVIDYPTTTTTYYQALPSCAHLQMNHVYKS